MEVIAEISCLCVSRAIMDIGISSMGRSMEYTWRVSVGRRRMFTDLSGTL